MDWVWVRVFTIRGTVMVIVMVSVRVRGRVSVRVMVRVRVRIRPVNIAARVVTCNGSGEGQCCYV